MRLRPFLGFRAAVLVSECYFLDRVLVPAARTPGAALGDTRSSAAAIRRNRNKRLFSFLGGWEGLESRHFTTEKINNPNRGAENNQSTVCFADYLKTFAINR